MAMDNDNALLVRLPVCLRRLRCERIGFLRTTCDVGLLADSASKPCDRLDDLSLAETLVVAAKHINIHRLQRIVIQTFPR